jgi:hypothetical protein
VIGGWQRHQIMGGILLIAWLGLIALYFWAGRPSFTWIIFRVVFLLFLAVFLRVLWMFAADVIQYSIDGWDYDRRPPRADIRIGKSGRTKMAPRTIMWAGYPLFLLASGAATTLMGLQSFGLAHIID